MIKYAIKVYENILYSNPNSIYALNNLILIEEDYTKIKEYITKLLILSPNDVEINCNAAIMMLKHQKHEGTLILEKYLNNKSIPTLSFHYYINYLIKNNQSKIAEDSLKQFLEYNDDYTSKLILLNIHIANNNPEGIPLAKSLIQSEENKDINTFLINKLEEVNKKIMNKDKLSKVNEDNDLTSNNTLKSDGKIDELINVNEENAKNKISDVFKFN